MTKLFTRSAVLVFLLLPAVLAGQTNVIIRVDAAKQEGSLAPLWAYFGADEPNYGYAPHGRELIQELGALSRVPVQIRVHNLLTSGDGTPALKWGSTNAYTEDAAGRPVYDWTITDRIFDTYLAAGAKPLVEIGFMPEALSTNPQPYQHHWPDGDLFTGWAYPPRDYDKWAELVHQWVLHCVERYGKAEAATWNWEVWNEPNIPYWKGTPEEYNKLYDYTVDAVRRALPIARVGGPATTGPGANSGAVFLRQFLEHCATGKNYATGRTGAPLDFISFHAKGAPKIVDGQVRMGLASELRDVEEGLKIVASFPKFAALPVLLTEADPEGCGACSARRHPENAYRNGTLYPAYTAAAIRGMLELNHRYGTNLQGALTWAMEFEGQPYFEGFRSLATNGVDKPILNLFRMLGMMGGERVQAVSSGAIDAEKIIQSGVRDAPDVGAIAARSDHRVTVLAWNYQDEDTAAADAPVQLNISGLPPDKTRVLLRHYRIDNEHSNAFTSWKAMGSPQSPTPEQYAQLKAAGQLQLLESPRWIESKNGTANVSFQLPREALSLVEVEW